jgi:retron-type reverse transcriptase
MARLLSKCLNKWSLVGGRGVTQGHTPSDILAKLYLNSVDRNLSSLGFAHYRYVDDFRIFCRSLPEARRALMDLTQLLRRRGLQLASEKLEIFRADQARTKIAGIPTVRDHATIARSSRS